MRFGRSTTTMVRVHLRTGWPVVVVWILAIAATMALTVSAIQGLYDTPAKVHSYAAAVRDDALVMLNGRVAGLDSLGGIVANEFGFLASFAVPFMAVSLITRMTRKDEEAGRLETVLAGRIGRTAPLGAAVVVAVLAEAATAVALFGSLAGAGVPAADAALYASSLAALGLFFLALAAVAAQLVEHGRGVYAIGLGAIVVAYLLRGVGDVAWTPLVWLSPLGWQEQARAFGVQRWWPLAIPLVTAVALVAVALALAARRDVGSALLGSRAGAARASDFLRSRAGIAIRAHRASLVGWAAVMTVVAATYGAVARPVVDAVKGNPDLAEAMGAAGSTGPDAVIAMTGQLLALLAAGYAVQAIGVLRAEETSGRLEATLSGVRGRGSWLGVHLGLVGAGILVLSVLGGVVFAACASWSLGEVVAGDVAGVVLDYLPAAVFFGGLASLVFALRPRWGPLVWLGYAAAVVVAYLADPLDLAVVVRDLSPFHLVGNPPVEATDPAHLVVLGVLAVGCLLAGAVAFRRRGIPQG